MLPGGTDRGEQVGPGVGAWVAVADCDGGRHEVVTTGAAHRERVGVEAEDAHDAVGHVAEQ